MPAVAEERGDGEWRRTVGVVWLAVVIAMMGMSLVIPFLPLYLTELGVGPRETRLWAGWVGGVNFLCAAALAPVWGNLADRYGRKPMAIRALIGLAVAVGLMGYAHNVYQLFALRMLQGAFGGFVAEAIALVGTSVPRSRLGSSLGFLQTGVVGGNFMGPVLGGVLSHYFGYRDTFKITGGALVVAMLLIFFLVRETRREADAEKKGVAANVRELIRIPALRWMLLTVLCSQCGMMLINPQITLFLQELVDPEHVKWWASCVASAPALSNFATAPLWGRAGDRRGHAGVLACALAAAGLLVPWAALANAAWQVLAIRFCMGGFTSALNPSAHSVAAHSVDERRTAGAFSLLASAQMLGSCVGPFLSGPLATITPWGIRPLFAISGFLLLTATGAAYRVSKLPARASESPLPDLPAAKTAR